MVPELDLEARARVYHSLLSSETKRLQDKSKEILRRLGVYSFVEANYIRLKETIERTTNGKTRTVLTETISDLLDADRSNDLDYPALITSASFYTSLGKEDPATRAKSVVVAIIGRVFTDIYLEREKPAKA